MEPSLEDFFSGNRMKRHFGVFHFFREEMMKDEGYGRARRGRFL